MTSLTRPHIDATVERFKNDAALAAEFLAAILQDGDAAELQYAQQLLAKAFFVIGPEKP